jgi:phosphoribosylglycinamide formyltransferase-1
VSGGGTNLQAILDAAARGALPECRLAAVVSSKPGVYALERAAAAGIPQHVVDRRAYPERERFSEAICEKLDSLEIELVVLAGFLCVLTPGMVRKYMHKIINIHPSLIPAFCGEGYYGLRVHEAALRRGVKLAGATAHFVTDGVDEGPIILQRAVAVCEDDTPQSLQRRVMEEAEWKILPEAIALFCARRLEINGNTVRIKEAV